MSRHAGTLAGFVGGRPGPAQPGPAITGPLLGGLVSRLCDNEPAFRSVHSLVLTDVRLNIDPHL